MFPVTRRDTPWHGDQIFKQKEIPILFLDYLGFVGSIVDMYSGQINPRLRLWAGWRSSPSRSICSRFNIGDQSLASMMGMEMQTSYLKRNIYIYTNIFICILEKPLSACHHVSLRVTACHCVSQRVTACHGVACHGVSRRVTACHGVRCIYIYIYVCFIVHLNLYIYMFAWLTV